MKILKKGTKVLPNKIVYVKRCHVCGCKYTYTMDDITSTFDDAYHFLICPQCCYTNALPLFKRRYKRVKKR